MKNNYDVTINNFIHSHADIDNGQSQLLLNIKKIKKEKCSIFVIDRIYKDTRVKVMAMVELHINENDCLELVYSHVLKFRTFKNVLQNKSKIDNIGFVYKKAIRKLKRNKINIYYIKLNTHSNEGS